MSASRLLSFPEELVGAVTSFVPVEDLLHVALTCKELHRLTKDRLARNADYSTRYILQHDRLPLTVPTLLRLLVDDADAAWHLRALDFWGLRPEWKKWTTWRFYGQTDDEDPNWPEPAEDHSNLDADSFLRPGEVDHYERIMREQLRLEDDEVEEWRTKITEGWDEPLKGILMALAPRLDRVNFIAYDSWQSYEMHDTHPLTFFCLAITRIADAPGGALWPPGFHSLRKVSVCTTTDLRHPHDGYYANPADVAPLFLLPNIKTLNLTLLGYHDDAEEDDDEKWRLEPRSSSVEELGFTVCDISLEQTTKFIRACRSLRSFTIDDQSSAGRVLKLLSIDHAGSMEHLLVRSHPDIPPLKNFRRLQTIESLDVSAILPDSIEQNPTGREDDGNTVTNVGEHIQLRPLQSFLPPSIRKVKLTSSLQLQGAATILNALLQAIADLADDEAYTELREVCLYDIVLGLSKPQDTGQKQTIVEDRESLRRIRARKVELHVDFDESELDYWTHTRLHYDFSNATLTGIESEPLPADEQ